MDQNIKREILASSSIWVGVLLNLLPGLGAGYIYQRRWKAYWLTVLCSMTWIVIGASRQLNMDSSDPAPDQSDQFVFLGLILIALFSSLEAGFRSFQAQNEMKG